MLTLSNRDILHAVIDEMESVEVDFMIKLFQGFINDYNDRRMTPEEYKMHEKALEEDEWFE